MKCIVLIIAMLVSLPSLAENLALSHLSGTIYSMPELTPEGIEMILEVDEEGVVHFTRRKDSELIWKLEAKLSDITVVEDVFIIPFASETENEKYKLMVSGWNSSSGLMLYGNLLFYKNGKQQTGVPVTLFRERNS